jgi:hypothetical protein
MFRVPRREKSEAGHTTNIQPTNNNARTQQEQQATDALAHHWQLATLYLALLASVLRLSYHSDTVQYVPGTSEDMTRSHT